MHEVDARRLLVVARADLRQLLRSKDYWVPMALLGALFFVVIPTVLLLTITRLGEVPMMQRAAGTLEMLPESARAAIPDISTSGRTSYALAVYLLAPIAVVVPLTISTAVGAATIVGERERGTGEFLAHSPASVAEIYWGKILASFVPGYATTIVGFALYSVMVNTVVGPEVGGWFFPTGRWWLLMLWVIPPFLLITLSLVLRLSARVKSTAAAQQAAGLITLPMISISYSQAIGGGYSTISGWGVGSIAWGLAIISLLLGVRSVTRTRLLGVAIG